MAIRIKASKEQRAEAKEYIKTHLPEYLEREGINPMHNFLCLNPDHNDDHGDMSYHRPSNTCVCHCGARYDTFDLISIEYGLTSFNDTFNKGCEIFGLLGQSESEESIKIPEDWRRSVTVYELPERASDEKCSAFYYALTKCEETELRQEHRADLLRRGLSEEDIKRFRFCSTPKSFGEATWATGRAALMASEKLPMEEGGFPDKVPGFYLGERSWTMVNDTKGYYCPVFNGETNQILGFQIRADEPGKRGKYVWFSSPRKNMGTSSGVIPTILPGKDRKTWIVIEGILKALVVYCLLDKKVSVIGVPGVDCISGFKQFMEEHADPEIVYFTAYDMDKTEKDKKGQEKAVLKAERRLFKAIEDNGSLYHPLTWDLKNGKWQKNYKGLDDFLLDYIKEDGNKEKFLGYLYKLRREMLSPAELKTA